MPSALHFYFSFHHTLPFGQDARTLEYRWNHFRKKQKQKKPWATPAAVGAVVQSSCSRAVVLRYVSARARPFVAQKKGGYVLFFTFQPQRASWEFERRRERRRGRTPRGDAERNDDPTMSAHALPPFKTVRPKMITHHVFNERMAERGRAEAKRAALVQTLQQGADLKANAEGLMRAQNLQRRNVAAMKSAEQMFGREFEERTEFDRRKRRDEEQQAALAKALGEQKQEELRWSNKLAQICENDPGLRELQSQLKAAYMNQERAAQQEERRLIVQEELQRERSLDQAMERDRQMALAELAQKNEARKIIATESREILTRQIEERRYAAEVDGLKAYEQDKRMIDEIVKKVREDDRRETEIRLKKQEETRSFIKHFQKEREKQLDEQRRAEAEEEAKIEAYRKEREGRGKAAAARKAAKQAEADRQYKEIERKVRAERLAREELENLRNLLHDEENWRKQEDAALARKAKREQMKRDMIEANELQKVFKTQARERERAEEMVLIQKMLDKFADDERKERENAEKRIQAKKEYIAAIEKQRRGKRQQYVAEMEREKQELLAMKQEEEFRQQVVEEARKRLLAEHAVKLRGFLPKGILRNKEEYDLVQRSASNQLAQMEAQMAGRR